ncbi:MAG: hypothetical protein AB1523_05805 [Bacillota bacterium]
MIKISLLPPEIEAQWRAQERRRRYLLGSALVLAVFLTVYGMLIALTVQTQAQARALQGQRLALEKRTALFQEYAQMRARLTETAGLLRQALGADPDWGRLLTDLNRHLPPNVWLTDFSAAIGSAAQAGKTAPSPEELPRQMQQALTTMISQGGAPGDKGPSSGKNPPPAQAAPAAGEVVLRGWALDQAAVSRWLEEIRSLPGLGDVRCQFAGEENLQGKSLIKFEIKAAVFSGAPSPPAAEKGKS